MKWFFRILIGVITLAGIGLMGYPLYNNYLYEKEQKELAAYYDSLVKEIPPTERDARWAECEEYNRGLLTGFSGPVDPFENNGEEQVDSLYNSLLRLDDTGAMGSFEVPGLIGPLVIYHGTDEEVLQKGVGHTKTSSLPVGGKGTHAILSAHTGLTNKKLFTNLDQVEMGDVFFLYILGEKLAYQVDQIKVVLPYETEDLRIDPNEDYVTLVTCTPYGINSHRLLVRGTRIPYEEAKQIANNTEKKGASTWLSKYLKSLFIGVGIATGLWIILRLPRLIIKFRKKRKEE